MEPPLPVEVLNGHVGAVVVVLLALDVVQNQAVPATNALIGAGSRSETFFLEKSRNDIHHQSFFHNKVTAVPSILSDTFHHCPSSLGIGALRNTVKGQGEPHMVQVGPGINNTQGSGTPHFSCPCAHYDAIGDKG